MVVVVVIVIVIIVASSPLVVFVMSACVCSGLKFPLAGTLSLAVLVFLFTSQCRSQLQAEKSALFSEFDAERKALQKEKRGPQSSSPMRMGTSEHNCIATCVRSNARCSCNYFQRKYGFMHSNPSMNLVDLGCWPATNLTS